MAKQRELWGRSEDTNGDFWRAEVAAVQILDPEVCPQRVHQACPECMAVKGCDCWAVHQQWPSKARHHQIVPISQILFARLFRHCPHRIDAIREELLGRRDGQDCCWRAWRVPNERILDGIVPSNMDREREVHAARGVRVVCVSVSEEFEWCVSVRVSVCVSVRVRVSVTVCVCVQECCKQGCLAPRM